MYIVKMVPHRRATSNFNIMTIMRNSVNNSKAFTFAYIIESQNVWHERLGHVNYYRNRIHSQRKRIGLEDHF